MEIKKLIKSKKESDDGLLIIPDNIVMSGNYIISHLDDKNRKKLIELLYVLSNDLINDKSKKYKSIECTVINNYIFTLNYSKNNFLTKNNNPVYQISNNLFLNFNQLEILDNHIYYFDNKNDKKIFNRINKIKKINNKYCKT